MRHYSYAVNGGCVHFGCFALRLTCSLLVIVIIVVTVFIIVINHSHISSPVHLGCGVLQLLKL